MRDSFSGRLCTHHGEVSERFKEHAWKACVGETQPWVQIPPSPPFSLGFFLLRCDHTKNIDFAAVIARISLAQTFSLPSYSSNWPTVMPIFSAEVPHS